MASADEQRLDDKVLSRYLLGSLPPEETERLDESSIADDELALRLDAVENDLVDAYARGELSGDTLEQFQKFYLSSSRRREKVEFARTLLHFGEKTAGAAASVVTRPAISGSRLSPSPRRWFTVSGLPIQWGFAAAAMAMLLASTYLFIENGRLRQQTTEARQQQTALNKYAQELESQLGEQRSANASMVEELDRLRQTSGAPHALKIVAALLRPQMRGASQVPTVALPAGTDRVQLRLQLESDDFPSYQVALKDPATDKELWRSANLKARPEGQSSAVLVKIQVALLKRQNYILELTGIPLQGAPEIVSSYAFKVEVN